MMHIRGWKVHRRKKESCNFNPTIILIFLLWKMGPDVFYILYIYVWIKKIRPKKWGKWYKKCILKHPWVGVVVFCLPWELWTVSVARHTLVSWLVGRHHGYSLYQCISLPSRAWTSVSLLRGMSFFSSYQPPEKKLPPILSLNVSNQS